MFRKPLLLLVLAPAILALTVACGSSKKSTSATATTQTSAQPTTSTSGGGGGSASSSDIQKVAQAFAQVKSFRAQVTINVSGQNQQGTIEEVVPDKLHIALGGFEIIQIGNDSYLKVNGTWTKQNIPAGAVPINPGQISKQLQDASGAASAVQKGGTDTVNGKKCQLYTDPSSSTEFCISTDTNLPLRIKSTGGDNFTAIFTDYNSNVSINAPI